MLNSDKKRITHLLRSREGIDLAVISRHEYRDLYSDLDFEGVDDLRDLTQVAAAARRIASRGGLSAVLAPTEKSIVPAAWVRALLGIGGPGPDEALRLTHKYAMKSTLARAGTPVAPFAMVTCPDELSDVAERIGWPVVVKPVSGSGANGTYRVEDRKQLEELRRDWNLDAVVTSVGIQVEGAVEIESEFHCDAVVREGTVRFAAVFRYTHPVLLGPATVGSRLLPVQDPMNDELSALLERVVDAIGISDAVVHLEVFSTPHGTVVGEITARPGGAGVRQVVKSACGIDVWEEFVNAALGDKDPDGPGERAVGAFGWQRVTTDRAAAAEIERMPGVLEVYLEGGLPDDGMYSVACQSGDIQALDALTRRVLDKGRTR
ncbi:ATP-grasp domain-containing protein [Nocardiopsis rhodophaea]